MKKPLLLSLLLAAAPTPLMAAAPSFDFVEFGYTRSNPDGTSKMLDGQEFRGSLSFKNNLYVTADYFKVGPTNSVYKLNITGIGVGYKFDVSERSAVFTEIDGIVYDPDGHGSHEHGYELTAGIRSQVMERLELKTTVEVLNAKGFSSNTLLLGAAYNLTRHLSVYSDLRLEADSTRGSIGARYRF